MKWQFTHTSISAPRSDTSPETALRPVVTVVVDSAVNKVAMVADKASVVVVRAVKPVTHVVVTATCPVIALKDKSATIVVKLAT